MIHILLGVPVRLYREGIETFFRAHDRIRVSATVRDAARALQDCLRLKPEVAVLDWSMEGCLAMVQSLALQVPQCRTVLLTVPETEQEMMACAEAGVCGYATRDTSLEELAETIEAAARGELRCSPSFAAKLVQRVSQLARLSGPCRVSSLLTRRETEVLRHIERGSSNKDIAGSLGIEVATVKNHVHNLLEKLQAQSRAEAAAILRRWNLPLPPPRSLEHAPR